MPSRPMPERVSVCCGAPEVLAGTCQACREHTSFETVRWHCPVCKHDHEMFDEEHVASCLTCPCEHRYLDNITEQPNTRHADWARTWADVGLAAERGAK